MSLRDETNGRAMGSIAPWATRLVNTLAHWIMAMVRPPHKSPVRSAIAKRRLIAGLIFASLVIAATMIWMDAAAMAWQARLSREIVQIFAKLTDYGRSGWFLFPIGAVLLVMAAINFAILGRMANLVISMLVVRLGFVFMAIGLPGLVVTIGKRLIGRVRPSDLGPFAYEPLSWRAAYASLPSGHATTSFAALVAIGLLFPRARMVLWIYALVIAVSRVAVSAHYPSDVLAGAICGVLGAFLVRDWFAARRFGFFVGSDGRVHTMPGPSFGRIKKVVRCLFA